MIRKLAPYTRGYRIWIVLGVLCSAGEAVLELLLPKLMSNIVDVGIAGGDGVGMLFAKGQMIQKLPYDELLPALLSYIDTL